MKVIEIIENNHQIIRELSLSVTIIMIVINVALYFALDITARKECIKQSKSLKRDEMQIIKIEVSWEGENNEKL